MPKTLPDAARLNRLLRYDPGSGRLYWNPRVAEDFVDGARKAELAARMWNAQFANKGALTADNGVGYRVGIVEGHLVRAHRVIWCMVYGYWPEMVDHRDHNRSNNRLTNLRDVGREENARNARISLRNKSGRTGVHWDRRRKRWAAKIRAGGRYIPLGFFEQFSDACLARAEAEQRYGYSVIHGAARSAPPIG